MAKNGKANGKANNVGNKVDVGTQPGANGGTLNGGGTPGNKGNRGALGSPPSAIRQHCRGSFAERVPILEAIADGDPLPMTMVKGGVSVTVEVSASVKERVSAIETLGKYGGVDKLALIADELPDRELTPELIADTWRRLRMITSIEELEVIMVDHAQKQLGSGDT